MLSLRNILHEFQKTKDPKDKTETQRAKEKTLRLKKSFSLCAHLWSNNLRCI
jgi:hypothetical protein